MEKLCNISKSKTRDDCGSDHECEIAKFRLKLKDIGKITRQFRYDLNQTLYDNTVEVTSRLKGLDLIDRVPEKLQMEVLNIIQEMVINTDPRKINKKEQNNCLKRPYK